MRVDFFFSSPTANLHTPSLTAGLYLGTGHDSSLARTATGSAFSGFRAHGRTGWDWECLFRVVYGALMACRGEMEERKYISALGNGTNRECLGCLAMREGEV